MSYIDFDEKSWREFNRSGQRSSILRETLSYTTDPIIRQKIQKTIDAIERQLKRRWWQFWKEE